MLLAGATATEVRTRLLAQGMNPEWLKLGALTQMKHRMPGTTRQLLDHGPNGSGLIPWQLLGEDRHHSWAIILRYMHPDRLTPIPQTIQDKTASLLRRLSTEDSVINYDVRHEKHWHTVPRRWKTDSISGIKIPVDTGIIRNPFVDDEGNPR